MTGNSASPSGSPGDRAASVRDFYDRLAPDCHLICPDRDAGMARQATALSALPGPGPGVRRVAGPEI
ncbi:hypothetical protein [Streptomyces sasae]|uniref:hypothetical protein n=1 Tax=Streptomyces sasae TaxID=1266772 RepID=UPI00292E7E83|nr:hypothetical protein [Streptomyces sasae]